MVATIHAKVRAYQRYGIKLNRSVCQKIDRQIPEVRIRPGMRHRLVVERDVLIHGKLVRLVVNRRARVIVTVLPTRVPMFLH